MEEERTLTKGKQVILGIIFSIGMYMLYYGMAFVMGINQSIILRIITISLMLVLPIATIIISVKLIKGVKYKVIGLTVLILTAPIILFSLLMGACFSFFSLGQL